MARASGVASRSPADYVAGKYLADRTGVIAVSLGCGGGSREARWARTGRFASIVGYDISESWIATARSMAESEQLDAVLRFEVADACELDLPSDSVDAVIFEDALHHLAPIDVVLDRARMWLRPGGYLFVNEYVGPRRFQFTDRQLEAVNGLLAALPYRLRTEWKSGQLRRKAVKPSILRMRLTDPSEAIESDLIVPAIRQRFNVLEERAIGGTIVNLLLGEIAHHFVDGREPAGRFLRLLFDFEDALIEAGELTSDHMLLVATV